MVKHACLTKTLNSVFAKQLMSCNLIKIIFLTCFPITDMSRPAETPHSGSHASDPMYNPMKMAIEGLCNRY